MIGSRAVFAERPYFWIGAQPQNCASRSRQRLLLHPASNRLRLALISPRPSTNSSVLSRPKALLKPPPLAS
jgi:hypothetical protein